MPGSTQKQPKAKGTVSSVTKKTKGTTEAAAKGGWGFFGFKAPKVRKGTELDSEPRNDLDEASTSWQDQAVTSKPEPQGSPISPAAPAEDENFDVVSEDTPVEKVAGGRGQHAVPVPLPTPFPLKIATPVSMADRSSSNKTELFEDLSLPVQKLAGFQEQSDALDSPAASDPGPSDAAAAAITLMPPVIAAQSQQQKVHKKRGSARSVAAPIAVNKGQVKSSEKKKGRPARTTSGTLQNGADVAEYMKSLAAEADQLLPQDKAKKKKEKQEAPLIDRLHKSWGGLTYIERLEKAAQARTGEADAEQQDIGSPVPTGSEASDAVSAEASGKITRAMQQLSIQGKDKNTASSPFAFKFNGGPQSPGPTPAVGRFKPRTGKVEEDAAATSSATKSTKKARMVPPLGVGADTQVTATDDEGTSSTHNRKSRRSDAAEAHKSLVIDEIALEAGALARALERGSAAVTRPRTATSAPAAKTGSYASRSARASAASDTATTRELLKGSAREQSGGRLRERPAMAARPRSGAVEKRSMLDMPEPVTDVQTTDQEKQGSASVPSSAGGRRARMSVAGPLDDSSRSHADKVQVLRLQAMVDSKGEEIAKLQSRNASLEQQARDSQEQSGRLQQENAMQQKRCLQLERELAALRTELGRKDTALQRAAAEKETLQKQVEAEKAESKASKKQGALAVKQRDAMKKEVGDLRAKLSRMGAAFQDISQQVETLHSGGDATA